MEFTIYKVVFKAFEQSESKNLNLSFRRIFSEKPISIPASILFELKKLSEERSDIINFQNIDEVLTIGNTSSKQIYNYYLVLLFTNKKSGIKKGYLIGNLKNTGDTLIGCWPFNKEDISLSPEIIQEEINDILKNPQKYNNICLITQ
ncbi:MAG: hypothetical protein ACFFB0_17965 [Promethearchaeota archaeon]